MICGCSGNFQDFCKDFNCEIEETEEGVAIKITAKDKTKLEALKHLVKAHKILCGC